MNRYKKKSLAAEILAKLAAIKAAPDECARLGEDYAKRAGTNEARYPFAYGALEQRVAHLCAELEAIVVSELVRRSR